MKKGVVLRVKRLKCKRHPDGRGTPRDICTKADYCMLDGRFRDDQFERLTKIRLKPGEACRVRVTRIK